MDHGSQVMEELIKRMENMSVEEYDALYNRAEEDLRMFSGEVPILVGVSERCESAPTSLVIRAVNSASASAVYTWIQPTFPVNTANCMALDDATVFVNSATSLEYASGYPLVLEMPLTELVSPCTYVSDAGFQQHLVCQEEGGSISARPSKKGHRQSDKHEEDGTWEMLAA